ncbi:MAG: acylphosphatase [Sedimentisphaerales bacterium]|nr:acylphosphatase [Sedimentisphaerales bacterium]
MSKTAKHIVFSGRVQGVGFRFTVLNVANRYGLTGQVRNMPDGSVEMVAQGRQEDIDNCIKDIQSSFIGYISQTHIENIESHTSYKDFQITF